MATVIRFSRHGTKKRPYYRIVVQDKTAPRDGRFIEHIGAFNPLKGDGEINVERPRLEYWLSVGAQMSRTLGNLLKPTMKSWLATPEGLSPEAPALKKEAPAVKKVAKKTPKKAAAEA